MLVEHIFDIGILYFSAFHATKSGPDHLRMYNDQRQSPVSFYQMVEQSLIDDARSAYEYGLPSTTSPSNDFSFVDQRASIQTSRPTTMPTHQSWFGQQQQQQQTQHPFFNRSYSMPQTTTLFPNPDPHRIIEEQQQMAAALLLQQQNWARQQQQQQIFQQGAQQVEQVYI